jgi:hypothetical protein
LVERAEEKSYLFEKLIHEALRVVFERDVAAHGPRWLWHEHCDRFVVDCAHHLVKHLAEAAHDASLGIWGNG